MPMWINDSQIDPAWIKENLPDFHDICDCKVRDISNDTRKGDKVRNGATLLLCLTSRDDGKPGSTQKKITLVAKQVPPSGLALSKRLGLAREAMFYNHLAPKIQLPSSSRSSSIPKIHLSSGSMQDGSKFVIMEDLSRNFIDSGILFGPGNPNNWSRDLEGKIAEAYPASPAPTSFEVANQTFSAIAKVHARFWRDTELLADEYRWLRGSSWITGKDEDSWRASQGLLQDMWARYTESESDRGPVIPWDPRVRKILEKAMAGISWESHLERWNADPHFCLVHGDFWPGNVMISKYKTLSSTTQTSGGEGFELRLLDWEMVGVGSGPQELGQYVISNMDPRERREYEESLVRNYHRTLVDELAKHGRGTVSWEDCWEEYKIGGLERWLWFLVYFSAQYEQPLMVKWARFFHDQVKEFVDDHKIFPEDVTQPRP